MTAAPAIASGAAARTMFEPRYQQLDLRFSRMFQLAGTTRLRGNLDLPVRRRVAESDYDSGRAPAEAQRTIRLLNLQYHFVPSYRCTMMKPSLVSLAALLLTLGWGGDAAAGQGATSTRAKVDVSKLGPQVGARVPDFSLPDQTGRVRNLESIMGPRGAMLVFLRSADW
jgi:hypothetical protein